LEKKSALETNVQNVIEELEKSGYYPSTIRNYKKVYDRLLRTAEIMMADTLTHALAEHFVNDSSNRRTGQYCHTRKLLHQTCVRMLSEYEERGYLGWKPSRESKVDKPASTEFLNLHTKFLAHLQAENKSKNTIDSYRNIACKLLTFIERLGYRDLKAVPLECIHKFFIELRGTRDAGSLRTAAAGLRSFLGFADDARLLVAVPKRLLRKREIIPVLTQEEEQAIWDVMKTDAVPSRDVIVN
jgi:hypothetical protein